MIIEKNHTIAMFLAKRALKNKSKHPEHEDTLELQFVTQGIPRILIRFENGLTSLRDDTPAYLQYVGVVTVGINWLEKYTPKYVWAEVCKHRLLEGK